MLMAGDRAQRTRVEKDKNGIRTLAGAHLPAEIFSLRPAHTLPPELDCCCCSVCVFPVFGACNGNDQLFILCAQLCI